MVETVPAGTLTRRGFLSHAGGVSLAAMLAPSALGAVLKGGVSRDHILEWSEIRRGAWVLQDLRFGGNMLVIADKGGVMLVDTTFPSLSYSILEDIGRIGGGAPLTLVNTHHHGDHTGGNAFILPECVSSYVHENAVPKILDQLDQTKQNASRAPNQVDRWGEGSNASMLENAIKAADNGGSVQADDAVPATRLKGGAGFEIGSTLVELHHYGAGHTDNDLVVHVPELNIVHTGDLLFNGTHPFFDPTAGVSPEGWINSLKQIERLCDPETVVVSGHGKIGDRRALATQIAYLEGLVEGVQDAIDRGMTNEEAQELSWGFMDGLEFGQFRTRAIGVTYDILKG